MNNERKTKSSTAAIAGLLALSIVVNSIGLTVLAGKLDNLNTRLENTNSELNYIKANMPKGQIINSIVEDVSVGAPISETETLDFEIPDYDTSFKTYMDYRFITDKTSAQYTIQKSAYTDENGFRRIGDDYIVALGTYFTEHCGSRFKITFEDGDEITVTVGDIKADCDTDRTNRYTSIHDENNEFISANIIEFIVDTNNLSRRAKVLGTVSCHEELSGNITKIERLED